METSKLQWWITNLNDDNYDDIVEEILDSQFTKDRMEELIFEIIYVYKIRPEKEKILLKLTEYLTRCKSNFNNLKFLIPTMYRFVTQPKTHRDPADQVVCTRFLRKLYNKKLLQLTKIIETIKSPPLTIINQVIFILTFFAPELLKEAREQFLKISAEIVEKYTVNQQFAEYLRSPLKLEDNKEYLEIVEYGWPVSSIEYAIMNDDVAKMKAHPDFSLSYAVKPNNFEQNDYTRYGCSLLQFCAFYSAEKCFFAICNDVNFDASIANAAVAGGSMKILDWLKSKDVEVELSLEVGATYRRYDYFQKFITPEVCQKPKMQQVVDDVLQKCMYTNNLGMLIFCHNCGVSKGKENQLLFECAENDAYLESFKILTLFKDVDINCRNKDNWTPLHNAAHFGSLKIIKHLVTIPGLDINAKESLGRTPLHIAAAMDELEVVSFLLTCTIVDPNCLDDWERTPLHLAAANGRSLTVQYLTKVKKVIINRTDKFGHTPRQLASDPETINILEMAELDLH